SRPDLAREHLERRGPPRSMVDAMELAFLINLEFYQRGEPSGIACESLRSTAFVSPEGELYPCHVWDRPLGSLRQHSFAALWHGQRTRSARAEVERLACGGCFTPCEAYPALAGAPRQLGAGEPALSAHGRSALRRRRAHRQQRRRQARGARGAPRQPGLRVLSRRHRSHRPGLRGLRRHRRHHRRSRPRHRWHPTFGGVLRRSAGARRRHRRRPGLPLLRRAKDHDLRPRPRPRGRGHDRRRAAGRRPRPSPRGRRPARAHRPRRHQRALPQPSPGAVAMSVSRRGFLRRAALGGAAAALALPWLEALEPRSRAAGVDRPKRFIGYFAPNGMIRGAWTPKGVGADFQLSPTLSALAGFEDRILVLSGLDNAASDPGVPGHHAAGTAGFLTAARPRKSETDLFLGSSLDQLHADHLAGQTPLHSLQLGLEGGGAGVGHCDNGFACAYSRSISWAGPRTPLSKIVSPRLAFDLLFAGDDPLASADERARRRALKHSALDSVQADTAALRRRLGSGHQSRLDEYLDSVRALERRVDAVAPTCDAALDLEAELDAFDLEIGGLGSIVGDTDEHARLMAEIMVLALRCDLTRSLSFMLGNSASTRAYPQLGVTRSHHDLSHHAGAGDKIADLLKIEAWEIEQLAYLLQRLAETPDGDGEHSLLDNSLVLFSSELSDGSSHSHTQLPVLLAGGCGGAVETGRHVVHEAGTAYGDMLAAVAEALDLGPEAVGSGEFSPLPSLRT
ncbi:MAG: DUF1552 domain-containing protein, partial [Myxococcales bacterium]|nr:DUF1552 domain-containing protein [Myxococcales bacterium]